AVTVILSDKDKGKKAEITSKIHADYHRDVVDRECAPDDPPNAICFRVSEDYADGIKKAALTNAVATIRDRINEKGVAEPTVVEKGDDIIVELPGDPKSDAVIQTEELIARTAKLEMKVVDDCGGDPKTFPKHSCTKDVPEHQGSEYMKRLYAHVNPVGKKGEA